MNDRRVWLADVSLEDRTMTVRTKKRDRSDQSLTNQAVGPVRGYRDLLGPAGGNWPVFPTDHAPPL